MYKVFLYLFLQSLFTKILLTEILLFAFRDLAFCIFTTLYRIGNIVINTLQLCVFTLDTQYSLDQVGVVSLSDIYQNVPLLLL